MRTPMIAGNWKCHKTSAEARELVAQLIRELGVVQDVEVVVCPPFTALSAVAAQLTDRAIGLGAQDMFWEPQGAFTGEIAAPMLVEVGCRYCIIGHSERRQHFGDTDEVVRKKLDAAMTQPLVPILCMGETLVEREAHKTIDVLTRQLTAAFVNCEHWDCLRLVIAYEPVWAIGTGKNATPEQAQEAHRFIRRWIATRCDERVGEAIRILYGGSVTPDNAAHLLKQPDVDGALVGGASLKASAFAAIVKAAAAAKLAVR